MKESVTVEACDIAPKRLEICFIKFMMGAESKLRNKTGPHVHLSWHDPGITIQPHYHMTDEFAIGMEGICKFPDVELGPMDFHYTDSGVVKGPIAMPKDSPFAHIVLRRSEARVVYVDAAGAKHPERGRQIFGIERKADWEEVKHGIRRKIILGGDANGPRGEVLECKKGTTIQREKSPFGEFDIFYRGFFETAGRILQSYAVRYVPSDVKPPSIRCLMDGGVAIGASFGQP